MTQIRSSVLMPEKSKGRALRADLAAPKGHMALKSSALCTTDCKLVSQLLVQERMAAHYKKLSKVKAAVDTTPPKTWAISQKVRDQARRTMYRPGVKSASRAGRNSYTRAYSAPNSSRTSSDVARNEMLAMLESLNDDDFQGGLLLPPGGRDNSTLEVNARDSSVNVTVDDVDNMHTMPYHHRPGPGVHHRSHSVEPAALRTMRSTGRHSNRYPTVTQSFDETTVRGFMTTRRGATTQGARGGDVLEAYTEKFTERKPFTPKTLKTNSKSKLLQFKYYNRPPPAPRRISENDDEGKNTCRSSPGLSRTLHFGKGGPVPKMTSESDLMHLTLQSRAEPQTTPSGVPPLNISLDPDHINWLQEQSRKSTSRRGHASHATDSAAELTTTATRGQLGATLARQQNASRDLQASPLEHTLTIDRAHEAGDEDTKYLDFISQVTNDVLDRGIFTDRALRQVFESHVERNKSQLDEKRMRSLLDDLRTDLNIPMETASSIPSVRTVTTEHASEYKTLSNHIAASDLASDYTRPATSDHEFEYHSEFTSRDLTAGQGEPTENEEFTGNAFQPITRNGSEIGVQSDAETHSQDDTIALSCRTKSRKSSRQSASASKINGDSKRGSFQTDVTPQNNGAETLARKVSSHSNVTDSEKGSASFNDGKNANDTTSRQNYSETKETTESRRGSLKSDTIEEFNASEVFSPKSRKSSSHSDANRKNTFTENGTQNSRKSSYHSDTPENVAVNSRQSSAASSRRSSRQQFGQTNPRPDEYAEDNRSAILTDITGSRSSLRRKTSEEKLNGRNTGLYGDENGSNGSFTKTTPTAGSRASLEENGSESSDSPRNKEDGRRNSQDEAEIQNSKKKEHVIPVRSVTYDVQDANFANQNNGDSNIRLVKEDHENYQKLRERKAEIEHEMNGENNRLEGCMDEVHGYYGSNSEPGENYEFAEVAEFDTGSRNSENGNGKESDDDFDFGQ